MPVITNAEAKEYIPTLSASSTSDDTLLTNLTNKFDCLAAGYIGFIPATSGSMSMQSATYTEYLDGPGGRRLYLAAKPVIDITSIYDDPDLDYTDAADLIAASDYTLHGLEGLVILDTDSTVGAFSSAPRAIKVTYRAGWASGAFPATIKHAAAIQVAHWYNSRAHIGRTNISAGGQTAALSTLELLPETRQALNQHRVATGGWIG